jgi:hypothetical protein
MRGSGIPGPDGPKEPSGPRDQRDPGPKGPKGPTGPKGQTWPFGPTGPRGPIELYTPQEAEIDRGLLASPEDYEATLLSEVHTARRYTHARSARRAEKRRELESEPKTEPEGTEDGRIAEEKGTPTPTEVARPHVDVTAATRNDVRTLVEYAKATGRWFIETKVYKDAMGFLKGTTSVQNKKAFVFIGACLCSAAAMAPSPASILHACHAIMVGFNTQGTDFTPRSLLVDVGWQAQPGLILPETIKALRSYCEAVATSFRNLTMQCVVGPSGLYVTEDLCSHIKQITGPKVRGMMDSLHITLGRDILYWSCIVVAFFFISLIAGFVTMIMIKETKEQMTRRISYGSSLLYGNMQAGLKKLSGIARKRRSLVPSQKSLRKLLSYGAVASVFIGILVAILKQNHASSFAPNAQMQDILRNCTGITVGPESQIIAILQRPNECTRDWLLNNAAVLYGTASSLMAFFDVPIVGGVANMTDRTDWTPSLVEQPEAMINGLYAAMSNSTSPEGARNLERVYKGTVEKARYNQARRGRHSSRR